MHNWTKLDLPGPDETYVMKVPTGTIYRVDVCDFNRQQQWFVAASSMVFVPNADQVRTAP